MPVPPELQRLLAPVIDALVARRAVFFVGAGVSASAGLPTWNECIEELKQELTPPTSARANESIAQFYRNQFGDRQMTARLRRRFAVPAGATSEVHETLAALPVSIYVTTNFDGLLEVPLRARRAPLHVICDDVALTHWDPENETQLIKLHGDIDRSDTIVFTTEDYARLLHDNSLLQKKLFELLAYQTVVFVGYSVRDLDVTWVLDKLSLSFGRFRTTSFILTDETDPHVIREWERRGIRAIQMDQQPDESATSRLLRYLNALNDTSKAKAASKTCDILLVDDDKPLSGMLRVALRQHFTKARVLMAGDGLEACHALGQSRPEIVLLDLAMPVMNGWEFLQFVKSRKEYQGLKIIVISAHLRVEPSVLLEAGVAAILPKPFQLTELIDIMERLAPSLTGSD